MKRLFLFIIISSQIIFASEAPKHTVTPMESEYIQEANTIATTNSMAAATFLSSKLTKNSSIPVLFSTGNFYFKAEAYKEAEMMYTTILLKDPTYKEVKKNLIRMYIVTENFDKAKQLILELIDTEPANWEYYLFLGNTYMLTDLYTSAETAYRQCLMIEPDNRNAQLGLCKALLEQEKFNEIIPLITEMISEGPDNQVYWKLLANVLVAEGKTEDALISLETAKRLSCSTPEMEITLANIYFNEDLMDNAVDIYVDLLKNNPEQIKEESLKNIIKSLIAINDIDSAKRLYAEARGGNNLKEEELLKLEAQLYRAENKTDKAVEIYKQILANNPIDAETLIAYAKYLKDKELYEEAISTVKPATRIKGYEAQALYVLADIELERRNFQTAVNYLENALIFDNSTATEKYLRQVKKLVN